MNRKVEELKIRKRLVTMMIVAAALVGMSMGAALTKDPLTSTAFAIGAIGYWGWLMSEVDKI